MQPDFSPAIAANRYGLGAKPGELPRIASDPRGWLVAQLAGEPPQLQDPGLRDTAGVLTEVLKYQPRLRELRTTVSAMPGAHPNESEAALYRTARLCQQLYQAEGVARLREAATTRRPFLERLTHFWANHFAVSVDKTSISGITGSFEREAIRPHVLGRFVDLLMAAEQHPAMLIYLDAQLSVGPRSQGVREAGNKLASTGINENLAREILELHTLGVDGGYTQEDVTALAEVITGWSIGVADERDEGKPGRFTYRASLHEPGPKTLLGKRYPDRGHEQSLTVLRDLAAKPATARFIATKLARHFIADDPPSAAVERVAQAFLDSEGDLPTVYRALVDAPEAWEQPFAKYKTPSDYIISSYRGLELPVDGGALAATEVLGQQTYNPGSPAGWPDRSADWDGSSALWLRINWAHTLSQRLGDMHDARALAPQWLGAGLGAATRTALDQAASGAQALALLLTAPEFLRR